MRLLPSLILATWIFLLSVPATPAQGQLIRINGNGFGGVNIRAPFVRVNTSPYGGTYVRAPFVQVNTPPGFYQPPYYAPAVPYGQYSPAPGYAPGQPIYNAPLQGRIVQPQQQVQPNQQYNPYPVQQANPNPANTPRDQSVPAPPAPENNAVPNQPTPAPQPGQQAKTPMKSVLDRPATPPQPEELPTPKPNPAKKTSSGK